MKKSTRALFVSAFVMPGLAQVQMGHKIRGLIFMFATAGLLISICINAVTIALEKLMPIASRGVMPDPVFIYKTVQESLYSSGSPWVTWALWGLLGFWLISIVDAAILGHKLDKAMSESESVTS
ncbi:hypothetical protein ACFSJ3_04310 [Corallincola platygyrae]|uniref:Uncharacterized protein n=1 Tax=Corallincola platygyrae TaxID=1193278 RepID=A0ABW4XI56_9GAMM